MRDIRVGGVRGPAGRDSLSTNVIPLEAEASIDDNRLRPDPGGVDKKGGNARWIDDAFSIKGQDGSKRATRDPVGRGNESGDVHEGLLDVGLEMFPEAVRGPVGDRNR